MSQIFESSNQTSLIDYCYLIISIPDLILILQRFLQHVAPEQKIKIIKMELLK